MAENNDRFEKTIKQTMTQISQDQSIKITKGVLKGVGDGDKININYQPIMIVNGKEKEEAPLVGELYEIMWSLLERLREPKLTNLRKLAVCTVLEKFPTQAKAAEYLQTQRSYMCKLSKELDSQLCLKEGEQPCSDPPSTL